MSDVASRSLGQVEAYFTVREILLETSKGADGLHWREFSGFGRFRFATLGLRVGWRFFALLRMTIRGLRMKTGPIFHPTSRLARPLVSPYPYSALYAQRGLNQCQAREAKCLRLE